MHIKKELWQNESKHKNALYTNICVANGAHKEMKTLYLKSNKIAMEKRKLGIHEFGYRKIGMTQSIGSTKVCVLPKRIAMR